MTKQSKPSNTPDIVKGPWLSNEIVMRLPQVRKAFDQNRDPYIARQLRDLEKTERQRQEEQTGRSSSMVKQDRPKPAPKPPQQTGRSVDASRFRSQWLAEQRAAAMAQHRPDTRLEQQQPSPVREYKIPER